MFYASYLTLRRAISDGEFGRGERDVGIAKVGRRRWSRERRGRRCFRILALIIAIVAAIGLIIFGRTVVVENGGGSSGMRPLKFGKENPSKGRLTGSLHRGENEAGTSGDTEGLVPSIHVALIFDEFRRPFVRSVMRSISWYATSRSIIYHLILPRSLHEVVLDEARTLTGKGNFMLYNYDDCDPWVAKIWFVAKHMHKSAMCKMFLAEILPVTVNRVLFLDSDSTVIANLAPCWFRHRTGPRGEGIEFSEHEYIGMSVDMGATCQFDPDQCYPIGFEWEIPPGLQCATVPYRSSAYVEKGRLCRTSGQREPYQFNSGVILMDLDKMRLLNFTEKFVRTSIFTWRVIERMQARWGDQCLVNNFLRFYPETFHEMPCGCNYQYSAERREVKCPNQTVIIAHGWNKQMANERSRDSYNIHFRFFRDNVPSDENRPPVPRPRSMVSLDWNATLNPKMHTATCPHQSFSCSADDLRAAERVPLYLGDRVNVLTRTARRPRFFRENAKSVSEQTHGNIQHIVVTDDAESMSYLDGTSATLIPSLYHKFNPNEVCERCNPRNRSECARAPPPRDVIARKMFFKCYCSTSYPMNAYMENLHQRVRDGWVLYLDDDNLLQNKFVVSELLANAHSTNELLVYRSTLGRVTPLDENFGRRIVAGDFDASNFMYHSKHIHHASWGDQRCGDYRAGSNLARYLPVRWIDQSFVQSNPLRAELGGLGGRGEAAKSNLTIVITSHHVEGWRPHWLKKTLQTYLSEEYSVVVDQVILVWNNVRKPPPPMLPLADPRLKVLRPPRNSLNNRWNLTIQHIRTSAMLNLDDDLYITLPAIICMLNWHWRHPEAILGPFVRRVDGTGAYVLDELFDSSPFSMVLPRAMIVPLKYLHEYSRPEHAHLRHYVDNQEAHCDDVLLNLLSQKRSRTAPIRVALPPSSVIDYYMTCYPRNKQLTGGLGLQSFRSERRTECARHLLNATGMRFRESTVIGTCLPRGNAMDVVKDQPRHIWEQVASKHVQCEADLTGSSSI